MKSLITVGSFASAAALCQKTSDIDVEVLVFSGSENPTITLTREQKQAFCDATANATPAARTCRVLGFTGWKVCSDGECQVFRGNEQVDRVLLDFVHTQLSEPVLTHIQEETTRLLSSDDLCEEEVVDVNSTSSCTAPVVGPDDPTQVHYDVQNDDDGCFKVKQSDNNCYNYGNDIVTNTFAQPGRGSGLCPPGSRPCVANTCDAMKNAAVSDGLTWVGTDLPTKLPEEGHYVSLHIWPDSNFHWLRMDANLMFSHKPGGTAVKNVDNNGNLITNPGKQDFSPWSQHCGYLHTVPSKVVSTVAITGSGDVSI